MPIQVYTDPESEFACKLLGGVSFQGIHITHTQMKSLEKLYGMTRHVPEEGDAKGLREFMDTGMQVSVLKRAAHDGQRLMAILAKYCEVKEDPARVLIRILIDAGYDEGALSEWANGEDELSEED